MKTPSTLSRVLSLIAAAGVSLALLQGVATLPEFTPAHASGPVMAHAVPSAAGAVQVAAR